MVLCEREASAVLFRSNGRPSESRHSHSPSRHLPHSLADEDRIGSRVLLSSHDQLNGDLPCRFASAVGGCATHERHVMDVVVADQKAAVLLRRRRGRARRRRPTLPDVSELDRAAGTVGEGAVRDDDALRCVVRANGLK